MELCRASLKEATEVLYAGTGMVYESYIGAQFVLRGLTQALVALIRFQIYYKVFDMGLLAQHIQEVFSAHPIIAMQTAQKKGLLIGELLALIGLVSGTLVYSAMAMSSARKVVQYNKLHNITTTAEQDLSVVRSQFRVNIAAGIAVPASSLAAIGILWNAGLAMGTNNAGFIKFIAPSFAVSDITAGIMDLIRMFRKWSLGGTDYASWTDVPMAAAAASRITFGFISLADAVARIRHWTVLEPAADPYPPLLLQSWSATASAVFYLIGAGLTYANL